MYLLESIRNELNIERWTLIGNSMGAGLALSYAQLYPEQTTGVVLFNGGRLLTAEEQNTGKSDQEEESEEPKSEQAGESAEARPLPKARQTDGTRPSLVLRALGSPSLRNLLSVQTPKFIIEASLKEVYGDPEKLEPETVTRYYKLLRREGNRQTYLNRKEARAQQHSGLPDLPEPANINDAEVPVLILWGLSIHGFRSAPATGFTKSFTIRN